MSRNPADSTITDPHRDSRVVLLDAGAERQWTARIPGRHWFRGSSGDWCAADEWLEHALARAETRMLCAEWAGRQLGLDPFTVLNISSALHAPFVGRLLDNVIGDEARTAHLCIEVLGWTPRVLTDRMERWIACASLLPGEALPLWIMDASEDLVLSLQAGDRLAMAGVPIGLRVSREKWRQFASTEAWDRCATRWRGAPVLATHEAGGEPPVLTDEVGRLLRATVPEALPLLENARAILASVPSEAGAAERARSAVEALLFAILDTRPATRGRFKLNAPLDFTFGTRAAEGDLTAPEARLVIEIDGYYHFRNTEDYRRDRRKDALLQEHGWFVLRFLAEDVVERMAETLRQIEATFARRMTKLNQASLSTHG